MEVLAALGEIPAEPKVARKPEPPAPLVSEVQWSMRPPAKPGAASGAVERAVSIPVWGGQPTIDGDLSDPIWKQARQLDAFTLADGNGKPKQQTDVLVGCDGKMLYVGATCHEDNLGHLTATVTKDGGPVWQDDCLEVFVDPALGKTSYRQIMANSLGKQGWNDSKGGQWRASSAAAAKIGTDAWTVELAAPLADLGITGPFGFNVCRERRPMETLELSCWSPTGGGFGRPERFGVATLGQAWIGEVRLSGALLGSNEFTVKLTNETEGERQLRTQLLMPSLRGRERLATDETLTVPAKGAVEHAYAYTLNSPEALTMTFRVLDAKTGELLAQRTLAPAVLAPLRMTVRPRMYYLSERMGTAEVEVNVSDELRKEAKLELALMDARGKRTLRSEALPALGGDAATVRVDLGGVSEGEYRLRARLVDGKGTRLAETETALARIAGPFD
jgi:hypothetical protein